MKYRTKLYAAFATLSIGTVLLSQGLTYKETEDSLLNEMRSKIIGLAVTSALFIDKNEVELAVHDMNDKTENFARLVDQLRALRDANRRTDFFVKYVYMIRPDPANRSQFLVVATATEDPNVYVAPGTPYPEGTKFGILTHLNEPYSPPQLIEDRWGKFMPAYAPIYDKDGKYLATIGVNLSAHYVDQNLDHLRRIDFLTMTLSLIAGLIVATFLAHGVSRPIKEICDAIADLGAGKLKRRLNERSNDEFAELSHTINQMAIGLQEREKLKVNFARYVSKHMLENILKSDKMPQLKGEKKRITVIFSDIRQFTSLSEKLSAEQVVQLLNEYLKAMLDVIFSHNGTLDKFMGDGLMIEFGAPLDDDQQELHAVKTAISMHKALKKLNEKWKSEGRDQIAMGIGIHTGPAVLGNIGSEQRMEYTAIGTTVNITSRIEKATKDLNVPLLVSETTWQAIQSDFQWKALGPIQLKGRDDPINVYTLEVLL